MTGITGKAMVVSLGVFLGIVFFGVSISMTHFNRLVAPEQPLRFLEWRLEGEHLDIRLMNENLHLGVDRDLPVSLGERAVGNMQAVMDRCAWGIETIRREIEESGLPETVNRVGHWVKVKTDSLTE